MQILMYCMRGYTVCVTRKCSLAFAVKFLIITNRPILRIFFPLQVIHGLQRRVEEQEEEIMQLRRQISQLQSSQVTVPFSESEKT